MASAENKHCQWLDEVVQWARDERCKHEPMWRAVDHWYRIKREPGELSDWPTQFRVRPGRVFNFVHTAEALCLNRSPRFYVSGYNRRIYPAFQAQKRFLNGFFGTRLNVRQHMKMAVRSAIKYGLGAFRVCLETEKEGSRMTGEQLERRLRKIPGYLEAGVDEEELGLQSHLPPMSGPFDYQASDAIRRDQIGIQWVPTNTLLQDPDSNLVGDEKFIACEIRATWDWAVAQFGREFLEEANDEVSNTLWEQNRSERSTPSPYRYVNIIDFWERSEQGWDRTVYCEGAKRPLMPIKRVPLWIGHPFALIHWSEDGMGPWPQSDMNPVWSHILEEYHLRTKWNDHLSRDKRRKTIISESLGLDPGDVAALKDPAVDAVVLANAEIEDLRRGFVEFQTSSGPTTELTNFMFYLDRDFNVATGITANMQGQALRSGTSATEAGEVAGQGRVRASVKFDAVDNAVATLGQKIAGLMAQFYSPGDVAREVGIEEARDWAKVIWTREDVQRDLHVILRVGSMRPMQEDREFQRFQAYLTTMMANPITAAVLDWTKVHKVVEELTGFDATDLLLESVTGEQISQAMIQSQLLGVGNGGSAPAATTTPSSAGQATQSLQG